MKPKKLGDRFEDRLAEILPAGMKTIASGALEEKQDNTAGAVGSPWRFLIQAKATRSRSYRVSLDEFHQLVEDAALRDSAMRPGWAIQFCGHQVAAPVLEEVVLLRLDDFLELIWEVSERGRDD
jgi:hypothetical protein